MPAHYDPSSSAPRCVVHVCTKLNPTGMRLEISLEIAGRGYSALSVEADSTAPGVRLAGTRKASRY